MNALTTTNPAQRLRRNKVPEITLSFWVIKVLSTTVGDTGADYLAVNVGWGHTATTAVMVALLAAALTLQVTRQHCIPAIYWLAVVLVGVVGTQITDWLTDRLGVGLDLSSAAFATLLGLLFTWWYQVEGSLSIRAIDSPRRECLYWAAVLCTFALGTAVGELAAEAFSLGFVRSAGIFGALLAVTFVAWRAGAHWLVCFWIAYILTRPFGAALGDWLTQAEAYGGLGYGASRTSLLFLSAIVVLVGAQQLSSRNPSDDSLSRLSR